MIFYESMKMVNDKFNIIRDSNEQKGHGWTFIKTDRCLGTTIEKLPTGDYTIKGLEKEFTIERKGRISEWATNLFEDRFHRELERLDKFEHPYLILEFPFEHMELYPKFSGIPSYLWSSLKVKGPQLIKAYHELRLSHPRIRVDFVGPSGKAYALSLFKRIFDLYN